MKQRHPLPLSPVQQRFWFLQQFEAAGQENILSSAWRTEKMLDRNLVQQRLNRLIERYDALRLVIVRQGDNVFQQFETMPDNHRLHAASLPVGPEAVSQVVREQASRAQKAVLAQGNAPLFRADLLSLADTSILLLTASRILCDTLSLEYIAARLLGAAQNGTGPIFDFASRVEATASAGRANLEKWRQRLQDATYVCELPLDRTRPAVQKGDIASHLARLSTDTLANIEKLARAYNVQPPVVSLATYFTLLYRYTLQADILIGVAHRPEGSGAPTIGPFTDIAVVRQKFEEGIPFAQLLTSIQAAWTEIGSNPPPSFPLLLEALNPERDQGRAPIMQHGFEFLDPSLLPLGGSPQVERLHASAPLSQLDLMLSLRMEGDRAAADWHYDAALFSAETIRRMHAHFEALLASAAGEAGKPVKQLRLATPEENEQVTLRWNATTAPVEDNDFVYRLFEKQATRTPSAIAARQPGGEITYEALNRRANRMARQLVEKGIGADSIVPILADREIDYLAAILAVNKAGGAFLPISPSYPAKRLAQVFEKCDARLVLAGTNYLEPLREAVQHMTPSRRPVIRAIPDLLAQDGPETNLPARCERHHLAYVMFTSGSTGEPKGVMVEHAGNINHVYAKVGDLEMGPADILAQTSRQSFDIVVWQFLAPLINGGSIYIMPDEIAFDPAQLLKESDRVGVTVLQLVPVNIEALLDVADAMGESRPRLESLRWMVPTGDALPTDLCRRWLDLYPHTRMLNTYGATECSDDQCHYVIPSAPPPEYRPAVMTIGRPIINTQVYVLDDAMQPVPVGVVGELYIGGVGVGRGYLKDAERTARTFVPNPFSADPNAKLYRSGDQSRYLPDGTVEFIGRIGHLIKIRGMRIEPGEIQSVLGRHSRVAQATIIVHEFPELGAHLIAYVVFRPDELVSEEDLRAYLRQYLPDYMIPSYFVSIDAIPLNANGKIDRKALPIPEIGSLQVAVVEPRTPDERALLEMWRKVLGREKLSIHDDFFDVGGNSLLAMRLFSQIERQFGVRLPLAAIFRAATIADQAALLTSRETSLGAPDSRFSELACVVPIQSGDPARPPFFCIHAGGGHVVFFRDLALHLGKDQTFYGIQAYGIDGNREPKRTYEEFAAAYVQEMRTIQPEGPYYIGGECLGGSLAFEVARQLEEQGQKVGLVVMFDSYCAGIPTLKPGMPRWLYQLLFHLRRSRIHFSKLRQAPFGEKVRILGNLVVMAFSVVAFAFFRWRTVNPLSQTEAALDKAEKAYRPSVIDTPITLFNSRLPMGVSNDQTLGWSNHTRGGVEIHRLPTAFDLMIESPDVTIAAEHLRTVLDQKFAARKEPGTTPAGQ